MRKILIFESKEQAEKAIPLNQIRKIKIDLEIICLANTSNGFVAFEKNCPHMTDDLSKGNINNQMEVVCPWHSYRFNLKNGQESDQRCKPLQIFHSEWCDNKLFVSL